MTAEALKGVRASNLVGCLRKGAYDGFGTDKDELPKKVRRLFKIRSMQNDALAAEMREEAEAAGRTIVLEQPIPWGPKTTEHPNGIWEGHADLADHSDHIIVELTGSADLSPDRRKMLQAAFYAKRMSELTGHEWGAWVRVFNPSTGEDRVLPVNWQEIVWEIDLAVADLEAHLNAGTLPERIDTEGGIVCESPNSGPAMFCPYASTCFAGYQYPIPGKLEGPLALDVIRAHNLSVRADVKLIEADLKPLKKHIAAGLAPKGKYVVPLPGGQFVETSYSEIPGRVTFSVKEMEDAGFELPPELVAFVKRGEPSVRLTTKLVGEEK